MEKHTLQLTEQEVDIIYHALESYPAHLRKNSAVHRALQRKIVALPELNS